MRLGTSPEGCLSPVAGARGARYRPDRRRRSLFASDSSLSPRSGHRLLIGRNGPTRALGTPAQGRPAIRWPARATTGTMAQRGSTAGAASGIRNAPAAPASAAALPARCRMRAARLRHASFTDSERGRALPEAHGRPNTRGHPPDRGVAASALQRAVRPLTQDEQPLAHALVAHAPGDEVGAGAHRATVVVAAVPRELVH